MGCDIHTVFQAKLDGAWVDIHVPCWDEPRSYTLFGWLAGVRGDATPIAADRGLPPDFAILANGEDHPDPQMVSAYRHHAKFYAWGEEKPAPHSTWEPYLAPDQRMKDMGEHSHTWLLLSEVNDAAMRQPEGLGWFVSMCRAVMQAYPETEVRMVMGFDS